MMNEKSGEILQHHQKYHSDPNYKATIECRICGFPSPMEKPELCQCDKELKLVDFIKKDATHYQIIRCGWKFELAFIDNTLKAVQLTIKPATPKRIDYGYIVLREKLDFREDDNVTTGQIIAFALDNVFNPTLKEIRPLMGVRSE
jgi:hypothetical protein